MSTKATIAHGEAFHIYGEFIEGGTYLELDTEDFSVNYAGFQKQPRLRVRLPKALLDRLTLDGKSLEEELGWGNDPESYADVSELMPGVVSGSENGSS